MDPRDKVVEALRALTWATESGDGLHLALALTGAKAALSAHGAAQPAPAAAQEPVAWGIKWPDRPAPVAGAVYTNREEAERYHALWFAGTEVIPLYTTPPRASPGAPPASPSVACGSTARRGGR